MSWCTPSLYRPICIGKKQIFKQGQRHSLGIREAFLYNGPAKRLICVDKFFGVLPVPSERNSFMPRRGVVFDEFGNFRHKNSN